MGFIRKLFGIPKKHKPPAEGSQNAGPNIMASDKDLHAGSGIFGSKRSSNPSPVKSPVKMPQQQQPRPGEALPRGQAERQQGFTSKSAEPTQQAPQMGPPRTISRGAFAPPSPARVGSQSDSASGGAAPAVHQEAKPHDHEIRECISKQQQQQQQQQQDPILVSRNTSFEREPVSRAPGMPPPNAACAPVAPDRYHQQQAAAQLPPVPLFDAPRVVPDSRNVPKVLKVTPRSNSSNTTTPREQDVPSITPRSTAPSVNPRQRHQAAVGPEAPPPRVTPRRQSTSSFKPRVEECSSTVVCSIGELDASSPRVREQQAMWKQRPAKSGRMSFLPMVGDGDDSPLHKDVPDFQRFEQNSPRLHHEGQQHAPAPPPRSSTKLAPQQQQQQQQPSFSAPALAPSQPPAFAPGPPVPSFFPPPSPQAYEAPAPPAAQTASSFAAPPSFPVGLWKGQQVPDLQMMSPPQPVGGGGPPAAFGGSTVPDLQADEATMFSPEDSKATMFSPEFSTGKEAWVDQDAKEERHQQHQQRFASRQNLLQGSGSSDDVASAADTERSPSRKASSGNLLGNVPPLYDGGYDDVPAAPAASASAQAWSCGTEYGQPIHGGGMSQSDMVKQQQPVTEPVAPIVAAAPAVPRGGALCEGTVAKLNKKTKDWVDRYVCLDIKGREVLDNGEESQGVDFAYVLEVFEESQSGKAALERLYVAGSDVKFVQGTVFTVKTTADLNKKALTHFLSTNTVDEAKSWLSAFEMVPDCTVAWVGQDGESLQ